MTQNLSIAVVIPAYRCTSTIVTALDSVRLQSLSVAEVWIIDDDSPCEVSKLAAKYIDHYDLRGWSCVRQPVNGGAGVARDLGVRKASSTHVAFLDADDAWCEDHLLRATSEMTKYQLDVFGGAVTDSCDPIVGAEGTSMVTLRAMLLSNRLLTSTVVLRRAAYMRVGGFDPQLRFSEDYRLWLKLTADPSLRVGVSCHAHAIYRTQAEQTSSLSSHLWLMEKAELSNLRWLLTQRHIGPVAFTFAAMWSLLRFARRVVSKLLVPTHRTA